MKTLRLQKRIAADILKVGKNKVWFDSNRIHDIREAITKEDIRTLINEKIIKKKPVAGVKRRAGKRKDKRKRKGNSRGTGKKRRIIINKKKEYANKIRKLRSYIQGLKLQNKISKKESRILRNLAKAGMFKSKKDIKEKIEKTKK